MEQLYQDNKDIAEFYIVYITEAHASDSSWPVGYAKEMGIKKHTNFGERCAVADKLVKDKKLTIPCLIDNMDDTVSKAYRAWPDRVYLVGKDGKLGVASGPGPWGFKPGLTAVEKWLAEYRKGVRSTKPDLEAASETGEKGEIKITGDFRELRRELKKHYRRANYKKAMKLARRMHEQRPNDLDTLYNLACLHCLLGQKAKAYAWLQKAVDAGYGDEKHLLNDWDFKTIRSEDRFRKIIKYIREGNEDEELADSPPAIPNDQKPAIRESEVYAESKTGRKKTRATDSVLDGRKRSFIIVGYSTSYAWPAMLQDMLDAHTDGDRLYHVLNAVVGGSPVRTWIAEASTDAYERTFGAMVKDFFGPDARLRGDAPEPTVALCQQSLQATRTRKGPVKTVDDLDGIRIGADALESLATHLNDEGVEKVYIAMHIYKEGYEPEVGNERFALKALLGRGHDFIFEGPDLWSLTIGRHPGAFTEDRLHPNEDGMKIMAEGWYRTIAGSDAREDVIEAMHDRDYDVEKMMREYRRWRRDGNVATKKKEQYRARLGLESEKVKVVDGKTYLWAAAGRGGNFKWYDFTGSPIPAKDLQYGIGKDRIRAIDDPFFVDPDDPRLLALPPSRYRPNERPEDNDDIMVIGYAHGDDVRAYPAALLDHHELVNDRIGGKPVTVGW